jgi:hypothetical protein
MLWLLADGHASIYLQPLPPAGQSGLNKFPTSSLNSVNMSTCSTVNSQSAGSTQRFQQERFNQALWSSEAQRAAHHLPTHMDGECMLSFTWTAATVQSGAANGTLRDPPLITFETYYIDS